VVTEMDDQTVRVARERHWDASVTSDFKVEHEIYREDAVLDYPLSGERIRGRHNIHASRFVQPNKKGFKLQRTMSSRDLFVTEFVVRTILRGEHLGIPGRTGGQQNAIFRGSVRPYSLACASC
jgi:hypothetical protein